MTTPGSPFEVPNYEVLRRIGDGSYGEVWLARNLMGAYRAIKFVQRARYDSDKPYLREFEGLRKFEPISRGHEGLVDILDMGRNDAEGYFYYAMELADDQASGQSIDVEIYRAKTIGSELKQRGRLEFAHCLRIALTLSEALQHLHEHGLVHRDVKPSNVIFVHNLAKLADIGLVTSAGSAATFIGSEGYVPPEGPGTPQADIYGLGKVLYEMATGCDRLDWPQVPTDLPDAELDDFHELNSIILKACEGDPRRRYSSAERLQEDLVLLQGGKSIRRLRKRARLFKLAAQAAVSALALFLAGGAILYFQAEKAKVRQAQHLTKQRRLLQNIQYTRMLSRDSGWFDRSWKQLKEAAEIQADGDVRNHGAALLSGIDARESFRATNFGASTVVFDAAGSRLLTGNESSPCRLIDLTKRAEGVQARARGTGAVAFLGGTNAVQASFDPKRHSIVISMLDPSSGPYDQFELKSLQGTSGDASPQFISLAPDGSSVAAILVDHTGTPTLAVWETVSHRVLYRETGPVSALAFSPDARVLAVAHTDGAVLVQPLQWSQTGTMVRTKQRGVRSLAVGRRQKPNQRDDLDWLLAVGDGTGTVSVWDVESGDRVSVCLGSGYNVDALAFSPDGTILAAGGTEPVRLWDAATGQLLLRLHEFTRVKALAFSQEGKQLGVGTARGVTPVPDSVQVWKLERDRGVHTLHGLSRRVECVAFSPDSRKVAALSHSWELGIWSLPEGQLLRRISIIPGGFIDNVALAFSSVGTQLGFCSGRKASLFDTTTGRTIKSWDLPEGVRDQLAFDLEGNLIMLAAEREPSEQHYLRVRLRDLSRPKGERALYDTGGSYKSIFNILLLSTGDAFVVDGLRNAPGGTIRDLTAYERSGKVRWSLASDLTDRRSELKSDPASRWVVYQVEKDDSTLLVEPKTGAAHTIMMRWSIACVGPEVSLFAMSGEGDRGLSLWKTPAVEPWVIVEMDKSVVPMFATFDRTGNLLAAGNNDGTVMVCDLAELSKRLASLGLMPAAPGSPHPTTK